MNKSNFFKKILIWDLICFLFLIAIDRVTKFLAMYYCEQKNISLIENTLEITYLENLYNKFRLKYKLLLE